MYLQERQCLGRIMAIDKLLRYGDTYTQNVTPPSKRP